MVLLQEDRSLHRIGTIFKLGQHAIAQKLDGMPAVGGYHPINPLGDFCHHIRDLSVAQRFEG